MITKSKAFLTSDNHVFLTQEEAQKHEIYIVVRNGPVTNDSEHAKAFQTPEMTAHWIVAHKEELLAILSTRKPRTPKAKTKAVRNNSRTIQHSETAA